MSKQHYKAIASILRTNRLPGNTHAHRDAIIDGIVNDLCSYFQQDNPLFDPDKFRVAAFSPPAQHTEYASNYPEVSRSVAILNANSRSIP